MSNTFGIIYKATNIHNNKCYIGFCAKNAISYNSMMRVSRGERTHHKGYKVKKLNI